MAKTKLIYKNIFIENKLHRRLKMASRKLDAPMTELVSTALNQYLESIKPQRQITQSAV